MALGGKRPGAGRKKGVRLQRTIEREKAREYMIERIAQELAPIITAQIEAAKGVWREEVMDGEKVRIYQKAPDRQAGEYLLNQAAGRPKGSVDLNADMQIIFEDMPAFLRSDREE